jgi:hypothetical protein
MTTTAHGSSSGLRLPVLVLAVLALVWAPGASAAHVAKRSVPQLANPTVIGKQLVNRFFVLLARKDRAALESFLSPAFQVQRADGSGSGKKEYLANLATIKRFEITRIRTTKAGGTLVVRYLADVEGVVNGKPYKPGPAPRLSVFAWNGKRWRLAAHANFNPLTG